MSFVNFRRGLLRDAQVMSDKCGDGISFSEAYFTKVFSLLRVG